MDDLYTELTSKTQQLDACIKMLRKNGTAWAKAERDYKLLLRTECLKLRDEGMAIGLIDKICYGIPSVADARFERDCAKVVYSANNDAVQSLKLQMRLIEAQIEREWGNG